MVAAIQEEIKWWISAYGAQMVPGSTVGSAKPLKPVIILAIKNSLIDQNATGAISETDAKSLIDNFLLMGTKFGG